MVDMGVVLCENILVHLKSKKEDKSSLEAIFEASTEVAGAVFTAVMTTIVSFLPVFAMEAAEGRLFKPLAFTKTFALFAAIIVSITIIPPAAHLLFKSRSNTSRVTRILYASQIALGLLVMFYLKLLGLALILLGFFGCFKDPFLGRLKLYLSDKTPSATLITAGLILLVVLYYLTASWLPFGVESSLFFNLFFTALIIGLALYTFKLFESAYPRILTWCLNNKAKFLLAPLTLLLLGVIIWSNMGKEFMPQLDEGSYLYTVSYTHLTLPTSG